MRITVFASNVAWHEQFSQVLKRKIGISVKFAAAWKNKLDAIKIFVSKFEDQNSY